MTNSVGTATPRSKKLAEVGEIERVELNQTIMYGHRWPSLCEKQVAERKTDERIDLDEPTPPVDEYLFRDDLLEVFIDAAQGSIESGQRDRLAACLLRHLDGDSFAALETRIRRNHSLRDVLGYADVSEVDDATTLWRTFDAVRKDELKDCLHALTSDVLAGTETDAATDLDVDTKQDLQVLTVDGTHVDAWANTRDEIEDGEVEGAAWGKHDGWFYGYQVIMLVDPVEELPLAMLIRPGNEAEKTLFAALCEEFTDRFDPEDFDCEAIFADAEYDTEGCREAAEEVLEAPLNTGINPRRSNPLKALKEEIKELFEKHGEEIETPMTRLSGYPKRCCPITASDSAPSRSPPSIERSRSA